jgi:hypothetical protein
VAGLNGLRPPDVRMEAASAARSVFRSAFAWGRTPINCARWWSTPIAPSGDTRLSMAGATAAAPGYCLSTTRIRHVLWCFHAACADANMPETTRLATTIYGERVIGIALSHNLSASPRKLR